MAKVKNKIKTGLVLQGGGARGAYQVGVLKAVGEILNTTANPFSIISGTSVGAINAASLASSADDFLESTNRLERLWRSLRENSIFDSRARSLFATGWRIIRTFVFGGKTNQYGLLDNNPLRELLDREFKRDKVEEAFSEGHLEGFCITTSCYECGKAITHFETNQNVQPWMRSRRDGRMDTIRVDHLMASSALPFIFQAVRIDGTYQGDGAMRLTTPLSPVIRMGADKVVVIGVRDAIIDSPSDDGMALYPSIGEMSGHALDILFNDNLDSDIERVNRINSLLRKIPSAKRKETDLKAVDLLVLQPSEDLREIARRHESNMPKAVRFILKSIGAWNTDGRLPSYLLFEEGYIADLIELGYNDTIARTDDVKSFLTAS